LGSIALGSSLWRAPASHGVSSLASIARTRYNSRRYQWINNDQLLRHATLMLTPSIKARSKIGAVLTGRDMRRGDESMLSLDRTKRAERRRRLLSEVTSVLEVSGLNIVLEEKLPGVTRENACASLCCKRMFTPSKDLSSQI